MNTIHPCLDDDGAPVAIHKPSFATCLSCWHDAGQVATVVPGGPVPEMVNGISLAPWDHAPRTAEGWHTLAAEAEAGQDEPPFEVPPGLAAAAGVVIVETDGRVWLVAPSNQFGGYAATFPKGRVDPGTSLRCAAVREAFEESGLQVRIEGFLTDSRRSKTFTRYYVARRIGGNPACMGWESQAVHLVPMAQLRQLAGNANDATVIDALERWLEAC